MSLSPQARLRSITPNDNAPQHGPRPLPLFLEIARREIGGNAERMSALLQALGAYQSAERDKGHPPARTLLQCGNAKLVAPAFTDTDYGVGDVDILFLPSPINPPWVLDLDRDRSLLSWCVTQGYRPALLDWASVGRDRSHEDMAAYVTHYVLPALQHIPHPVHLAGYCLGGVLAIAAACLADIRSLTLIATPWDFSGYTAARRDEIAALWNSQQAHCEQMGVVPMELLQAGFWSLSPSRLVDKYLAFGQMPRGSVEYRRFVAMEDWANSGEALPYALGKQLLTDFYSDNMTAKGEWLVGEQKIIPQAVRAPAIEFASSTDQIAPITTSPSFPNRTTLATGHVGMVVGGKAQHSLWRPWLDWIAANG